LQKKSCGKVFTKKSTKNPKTDFFSILFSHVFGRFLVRRSKPRNKKHTQKKTDQAWYFFGLRGTNQPPQGPSIFNFFLSVELGPLAPSQQPAPAASGASGAGGEMRAAGAMAGSWWPEPARHASTYTSTAVTW
jgi:hypothetical protein